MRVVPLASWLVGADGAARPHKVLLAHGPAALATVVAAAEEEELRAPRLLARHLVVRLDRHLDRSGRGEQGECEQSVGGRGPSGKPRATRLFTQHPMRGERRHHERERETWPWRANHRAYERHRFGVIYTGEKM
eukprot:1726111-Prymnesium_polylepis.1